MTSLILDLQRKINIRNAFVVILVPFIYPMRRRVIGKGTSEEHVKQRKMACVNGCVFDAFWVESSLSSCKSQVCNNFFWFWKKLPRDTRVNLLVVYSNKIHMLHTLVRMHWLWKSVNCVHVISAPLLVHYESFSWIAVLTDPWFRLIWNCSCCKTLQIFISS